MSAPRILDELHAVGASDSAWATAVGAALDDPSVGVHLAVMVEPFLGLLLAGRKTVESRFSKNAIAPYRQVAAGDVVLLKSGQVVGCFRVCSTVFTLLHDGDLTRLRDQYAAAICAEDDAFWEARADKRYAALIGVSDVHRLPPVPVPKRDMRGWVIIRPAAASLAGQPTLL